MSAKENAACRKFQANFFNHSKCQNCFKSRESHLTSDQDLNQAKPIYGGWLLLAPEGTDFENPVQRSRKWQRRFFLLYEHGLLRYALDDLPSTLPQGTINMNLSTDVSDGESKTAQKNSLCIIMPEKQHFIRAENKETINGWFEMLIIYPRTNKQNQNQKKKRKVEPPTPQEPGPAKVAVTSSSMPTAEKVPSTRLTLWQEQKQLKDKDPHVISNMMKCPSQNQSSNVSSSGPSTVPKAVQNMVNGNEVDSHQKKRVESGYFSLEKLKSDSKQLASPPGSSNISRRSQVIEQFEALEIEQDQQMASSCSESNIYNKRCRGRNEKRSYPRKRDVMSESDQISSAPDISAMSLPQYRRAKSLDRRATESTVTPDLLNFKKGWMTKLSADGQWKKHWFVLTDQYLKYYRDSAAEEAVDLDGEIDLSSCYDVTEYEVQRNYGFQIHTNTQLYMLSAMTSGIRRNWIQAIMKNIHPATTPDVTRNIAEEKLKVRTLFEGASVNGEKTAKTSMDGAGLEAEQKKSRARERRKEGRSRTFDWAEFRPAQQRPNAGYGHRPTSLYLRTMTNSETDPQELERDRARRREERRKRFETTDVSFSLGYNDVNRMEVDGTTISPGDKNVDVEIEHRWQQVECTPLREEKQVPILTTPTSSEGRPPAQDMALMLDKKLEQSHQEVFRLHEQNKELQGQLRAALERKHNARDGYILQSKGIPSPSSAWQRLQKLNQDIQNELIAQHEHQTLTSQQLQTLKQSYEEANDIIHKQEAEIAKLQGQLSCAVSEGTSNEQALTKQKQELMTGNQRIQDQWKEWRQNKKAMTLQLKDREDCPHIAETLKTIKASKELTKQQAWQAGLQNGLCNISSTFGAREQERIQRNYEILEQTYEEEEEIQRQNIRATEEKCVQYGNKQQMEHLEIPADTMEKCQIMCHIQEEEITIQTLSQCLKNLNNEREKMNCRYEELVNQLMEADAENAKLQSQQTQFHNLESSYEKLSGTFQRTQKTLEEKNAELKETRVEHENLIATKNRKLNEALVKLTALGSSLEEAENKLQAKEAALQKFYSSSSNTNSMSGREDFQFKLNTAKYNIIELEQKLNTLQLGNEELELENYKLKEDLKVSENVREEQYKEFMGTIQELKTQLDSNDLQAREAKPRVLEKDKFEAASWSCPKKQRIRFSSIHCQRYSLDDRTEKLWVNNTSDVTLDGCCAKERTLSDTLSHCEPAEDEAQLCISTVHSQEHKFNVSEEKNDVHMKLEEQQDRNLENLMEKHSKLVTIEVMEESHQDSLSKIDALMMQLQVEKVYRWKLVQDTSSQLRSMQLKYDQIHSMMGACKQNIHGCLGGKIQGNKVQFCSLSEMKSSLADASHCLEQVERFLQQQHKELQETQDQMHHNTVNGTVPLQRQFLLAREKELSQLPEISDEDTLKFFADKLFLEALILEKMAQTLQSKDSDVVWSLESLNKESEVSSSTLPALEMVREPNSPADILLMKTISEGKFWIEVDNLRKNIQPEGTVQEKRVEGSYGFINEFASRAADRASLKAELAFIVQKMQESFSAKVQKLQEGIRDVQQEIEHKENMLREVLIATKTVEVNNVMQEPLGELENPTDPVGKVLNMNRPELILYAEQIKREETRNLALNVVDKQLKKHLSEIKTEWDFSRTVREELAEQLKKRAIVLQQLSEDLQTVIFEEASDVFQKLLEVSQVSPSYIHMQNINNYPSELLQEAMIQAQITYVVCRMRIEYDKELKIYKDSCNNIDSLCKEHAKNIVSVRAKYEQILQKRWHDYTCVLSGLEKENEALRMQASLHDSELELKQNELQELDKRYKQHLLQIETGYRLAPGSKLINVEKMPKQRKTDQNQEQEHGGHMKKLEESLHDNTQKCLVMHEEEKHNLCNQYEQKVRQLEKSLEHQRENSEIIFHQKVLMQDSDGCDRAGGVFNTMEVGGNSLQVEEQAEVDSMIVPHERIQELETQMDMMRDELGQKQLEGTTADLREKYQRDFDNLKVSA